MDKKEKAKGLGDCICGMEREMANVVQDVKSNSNAANRSRGFKTES